MLYDPRTTNAMQESVTLGKHNSVINFVITLVQIFHCVRLNRLGNTDRTNYGKRYPRKDLDDVYRT